MVSTVAFSAQAVAETPEYGTLDGLTPSARLCGRGIQKTSDGLPASLRKWTGLLDSDDSHCVALSFAHAGFVALRYETAVPTGATGGGGSGTGEIGNGNVLAPQNCAQMNAAVFHSRSRFTRCHS